MLTAVWMQTAASDSGDPLPWAFREAEVRVFLIVVAAIFGIALAVAFLGLKTPRTSGLVLILSGGVGLVLTFIGTAFGGLYMMPSAFLVVLGGAIMASSGANGRARA